MTRAAVDNVQPVQRRTITNERMDEEHRTKADESCRTEEQDQAIQEKPSSR